MKNTIKAFSMMELMVCVVAMSIMASVMVPAITQKSKKAEIRVNAEQLTSSCAKFTDKCDLCYLDRCVVCQRNCGDYNNLDLEKCVCKN